MSDTATAMTPMSKANETKARTIINGMGERTVKNFDLDYSEALTLVGLFKNHLTQREVAEKFNVSQSEVRDWHLVDKYQDTIVTVTVDEDEVEMVAVEGYKATKPRQRSLVGFLNFTRPFVDSDTTVTPKDSLKKDSGRMDGPWNAVRASKMHTMLVTKLTNAGFAPSEIRDILTAGFASAKASKKAAKKAAA